jgi:hypothetical protein
VVGVDVVGDVVVVAAVVVVVVVVGAVSVEATVAVVEVTGGAVLDFVVDDRRLPCERRLPEGRRSCAPAVGCDDVVVVAVDVCAGVEPCCAAVVKSVVVPGSAEIGVLVLTVLPVGVTVLPAGVERDRGSEPLLRALDTDRASAVWGCVA